MVLKRYLLIFNDRILDSRVEAGTPSCAAAPDGPEMRPPVDANAVSMTSFSSASDFLANPLAGREAVGSTEIHLGSTENGPASYTMTDRSITFCSSRMFPGQEYDCKSSRVLFSMVPIFFPASLAKR